MEYGEWISRMYPEAKNKREGREEGDLATKTVTFQVTEDCSLACKYCYQINKSKRRLSFDIAKLMVDKMLSGEAGFRDYM
jgi:sulfatase maturation enzyme AslB (radical SAM superfamily)